MVDKMGTFGTRQLQIFLMTTIVLCGLLVLFVVEIPTANLNKWQKLVDLNQLKQVQPEEASFQSPCGCLRNFSTTQIKNLMKRNTEWCSSESTYRGPKQQIVAFSLFRPSDDRGKQYFNLLQENAIVINQLLPGKNYLFIVYFVLKQYLFE